MLCIDAANLLRPVYVVRIEIPGLLDRPVEPGDDSLGCDVSFGSGEA
jgi:hypothetical protein